MKKSVIIILIIGLFSSSLLAQGKIETNNNEKTIELSGLVQIGSNDKIAIIYNPESRSRISYYVIGDMYDEFDSYLEKYVLVKGIIVENPKSEWSKEIKVVEIIKSSDTPIILE